MTGNKVMHSKRTIDGPINKQTEVILRNPNTGRLITMCSPGNLTLYEIYNTVGMAVNEHNESLYE